MATVGLIILASVAVSLAVSESGHVEGPALTGSTGPAPAFSLPSLLSPSQNITLASFRGKNLVVNFWASWCVPCRTEMPLLEKAYRADHAKVTFLGVDSNDTAGPARAFLAQVHVTYPAVSDPQASLATKYGLFGLPTTVFISPSGIVLGRHIGELKANTLRMALQEAFHE